MTTEAIEEIEREGWGTRPAIVIGREGWGTGIVGIVAGRLVDRYSRPVVVVGFEAGVGRGSVRGPRGARLFDAIGLSSALLDRFGGHQAAAGLEIQVQKLAAFRQAFEEAVVSLGDAVPVDPLSEAVWLAPLDEPLEVVKDIERLEPCGQGNPAPRLLVSGRASGVRELKGGHLRLDLVLEGGQRLGCFGIAMATRAAELSGESGAVTVLGELRRDTYRGGDAVELFLDRLLP
jgi:single-stranded-DNA-specific exonuclease